MSRVSTRTLWSVLIGLFAITAVAGALANSRSIASEYPSHNDAHMTTASMFASPEEVLDGRLPDDDDDGITNVLDNCLELANSNQRDTDNDGFGNMCDADFNNDGWVNAEDLGYMRSVFYTDDPDGDMNGDGVVNTVDLGLMKGGFFAPPGPAGYCVGEACDGPLPAYFELGIPDALGGPWYVMEIVEQEMAEHLRAMMVEQAGVWDKFHFQTGIGDQDYNPDWGSFIIPETVSVENWLLGQPPSCYLNYYPLTYTVGFGYACLPWFHIRSELWLLPDADEDGIPDVSDNCVDVANAQQRDTDSDGIGNVCDADLNNDCVVNTQDLGLIKSIFFTGDPDADLNGDGTVNLLDLGIMKSFFFGMPGPGGVSECSFHTRQSFSVGDSPASVAIGDLDADGMLDLVTANQESNDVSILLGNGDGTFMTALSFPSGSGPNSVAIGDFNGDEVTDVVTAGAGGVSVLLGNGDGSVQTPLVSNLALTQQEVAIGDLNTDGVVDLVTVSSGAVSVLVGYGDGTFQTASTLSFPGGSYTVAIGDLNGDPFPDLAAMGLFLGHCNLVVYAGNGDGTFQFALQVLDSGCGSTIAIGDLNADGRSDLAIGGTVLLGNGDGTFQSERSWAGSSADVVIGGANSDEAPDLILTGPGAVVSVVLGFGDGTFHTPFAFDVGSGPSAVALADLNADGRSDIVAATPSTNNVSVLLHR